MISWWVSNIWCSIWLDCHLVGDYNYISDHSHYLNSVKKNLKKYNPKFLINCQNNCTSNCPMLFHELDPLSNLMETKDVCCIFELFKSHMWIVFHSISIWVYFKCTFVSSTWVYCISVIVNNHSTTVKFISNLFYLSKLFF